MNRQAITDRAAPPPIDSAPSVGLAWLVRLRWAFVAAELGSIAGARWLLGTPVDPWLGGAAALATALTNAGLLAWSRRAALHDGETSSRTLMAAVLVVDGLLLTVALRASGGAMNPFSVLYIVHVALAALLLGGRATWLVAGSTCLGFGALFLGSPEADPHAGHAGHGGDHAGLEAHLHGMLVAYALAAAFVGYFVHRVARALERREREMIALRDWIARTERLASLSTLAAGAAHELGTPLATIAVVAKELERTASSAEATVDRAALSSDARLVREEAERCRRIIAKMASDAGEAQGAAPRRAGVDEVITRVRASLDRERALALEVAVTGGAYVVVPEETLVQVLVNLVTNAFDAGAPPRVTVAADDARRRVAFSVEDEGCGIPPGTLGRLGEPFFTTKGELGMGLGLFLARSFAERVGGSLVVESRVGAGSTFVLEVPGGSA